MTTILIFVAFCLTAPDSFCYKKFFQLCGLSQKTPQEVKDVFRIIDEDNSGFIEEAELKYVISADIEFTCNTSQTMT